MSLKISYDELTQDTVEEFLEQYDSLMKLFPIPILGSKGNENRIREAGFYCNFINKEKRMGLSLFQIPFTTNKKEVSTIIDRQELIEVLQAMPGGAIRLTAIEDGLIFLQPYYEDIYTIALAPRPEIYDLDDDEEEETS